MPSPIRSKSANYLKNYKTSQYEYKIRTYYINKVKSSFNKQEETQSFAVRLLKFLKTIINK